MYGRRERQARQEPVADVRPMARSHVPTSKRLRRKAVVRLRQGRKAVHPYTTCDSGCQTSFCRRRLNWGIGLIGEIQRSRALSPLPKQRRTQRSQAKSQMESGTVGPQIPKTAVSGASRLDLPKRCSPRRGGRPAGAIACATCLFCSNLKRRPSQPECSEWNVGRIVDDHRGANP